MRDNNKEDIEALKTDIATLLATIIIVAIVIGMSIWILNIDFDFGMLVIVVLEILACSIIFFAQICQVLSDIFKITRKRK